MPRFALHGASFCTAAVSLQLADVVDEAIEQPLCVHLGRTAQAEALQAPSVSDVGEHGLDGAQASSVFVPPMLGVDLALHARAVEAKVFAFTKLLQLLIASRKNPYRYGNIASGPLVTPII